MAMRIGERFRLAQRELSRADDPQTMRALPGKRLTVRFGDTLWDLADKIYGDGRLQTLLAQENRIPVVDGKAPLVPGTELKIPVRPGKGAAGAEDRFSTPASPLPPPAQPQVPLPQKDVHPTSPAPAPTQAGAPLDVGALSGAWGELWTRVAALPESRDVKVEGTVERHAKLGEVAVRAGTYQDAKQLEVTVPGKDCELHLVATFGGKAEPNLYVDYMRRQGDSVGLAIVGGKAYWYDPASDPMGERPLPDEAAQAVLATPFAPNAPLDPAARDVVARMTQALPEARKLFPGLSAP